MNKTFQLVLAHSAVVLITVGVIGCSHNHHAKKVIADPPMPLGTQSDDIWRMQEDNAEAAKFIVYEHEFQAPDTTDGHTSGGWRRFVSRDLHRRH